MLKGAYKQFENSLGTLGAARGAVWSVCNLRKVLLCQTRTVGGSLKFSARSSRCWNQNPKRAKKQRLCCLASAGRCFAPARRGAGGESSPPA